MGKIPVGIRLEAALMERLKNAIWYLGQGLTITSVVTAALEQAIRDLEAHNNGKPFPPRQGRIPKSPTPFRKKKKTSK
jgi:hypothetical protein